jgi:Domain of unknown function (DUF4410)
MNTRHLIPLFLILLMLAACSTTISTHQGLEASTRTTLKYVDVDVASSLPTVTAEISTQLKKALNERLAKLPQGATPTTVRIDIVEYKVASSGDRFFKGAFAGSNRMTVAVRLIDDKGKQIAAFDVLRSANPGGIGLLFDQQAETINAVADGVAEVLAAKD